MSAGSKRIVSFLLLCVFIIYCTPKEIYHAFTNHKDTVHHTTVGLRISGEHHHCELLKADQHFHISIIDFPYYSFLQTIYLDAINLQRAKDKILTGSVSFCKQLRAPPSFMI